MSWPESSPHQEENNQPSDTHNESSPEARRHVETILDHMPEAFWRLDINFHIAYLNRRAEWYAGLNQEELELVGYTQEDMAARRIHWPALSPPEYQKQVAQIRKELFATGTFPAVEKESVRKDGTRVPVEIGGTLFMGEGSEPSILCFILDRTANKEMERQKDLMLSMTSHELKTPLAALRGTLQLIRRRMKWVVGTDEHLFRWADEECGGWAAAD